MITPDARIRVRKTGAIPTVTGYTALSGGSYWTRIEVTSKPVIVTSIPATAPDYASVAPSHPFSDIRAAGSP